MTKITQAQAEDLLKDDLPLIYMCIQSAWKKYMDDYPVGLRISHSPRSRASLVHDHMVDLARQNLETKIGVTCHEINKLFLVSFDSGIVIRFKKLDESFKASNIKTQQSLEFTGQQFQLPNIDAAIKLQAGYRLNALETELEGIYLTLPNGSANSWVMTLDPEKYGSSNVTHLPKAPGVEIKPNVVRFTKRGGDESNEATAS